MGGNRLEHAAGVRLPSRGTGFSDSSGASHVELYHNLSFILQVEYGFRHWQTGVFVETDDLEKTSEFPNTHFSGDCYDDKEKTVEKSKVIVLRASSLANVVSNLAHDKWIRILSDAQTFRKVKKKGKKKPVLKDRLEILAVVRTEVPRIFNLESDSEESAEDAGDEDDRAGRQEHNGPGGVDDDED